MSAVVVRHLSDAGASRLVVFGRGPHAWVMALRAVCPLADVVVVGSHRGRVQAFAERVHASGLHASLGEADAGRRR